MKLPTKTVSVSNSGRRNHDSQSHYRRFHRCRFHKRKRGGQRSTFHQRLWTDVRWPNEIPFRCEQPFIKFKAVFSHREMDNVVTRFFDVEKDFIRFAAMLFFSALPAFPTPCPLPLVPLQSLTTRRPLTIKTNVKSIVFAAR